MQVARFAINFLFLNENSTYQSERFKLKTMTDLLLRDMDPEDMSEVLMKIEDSFGFKFGKTELKDVTTFGELCDIIVSKFKQYNNVQDCTTQQAFYKLRDSISKVLSLDKSSITTDTQLHELLPKQSHRHTIRQIEEQLGFKLNLLHPPNFISIPLGFILVASFIGLFINWQPSLVGFVFSLAGIMVASHFANVLTVKTVGQVADKMSKENYLKSRRISGTVNKTEIEKKVKEIFSQELELAPTTLTRDATFN